MEIKDGGTRVSYGHGAMKEATPDKGRMDLLPMDIIVDIKKHTQKIFTNNEEVFNEIDIEERFAKYQQTGDPDPIREAVYIFSKIRGWCMPELVIETSKQFEGGEKKYPSCVKNGKFQINAQRGLPIHRLYDSGVRHFLQWLKGDVDEPHDRAFCWNMIMLLWYIKYHPENDNMYHEGFVGKIL